jgi:hypothetical protein
VSLIEIDHSDTDDKSAFRLHLMHPTKQFFAFSSWTTIYVVVILCVLGTALEQREEGCGSGMTPIPNACFQSRSGPNCMNIGTSDVEPVWVCRPCSHNCDCNIGEYCMKGPTLKAGQCVAVDTEDSRIGNPCTMFGIPGSVGSVVPTLGVDDKLVCGSPIFSVNGTFLRYDWIGDCFRGVCRECGGGPMTWSIETALHDLGLGGIISGGGSKPTTGMRESRHGTRVLLEDDDEESNYMRHTAVLQRQSQYSAIDVVSDRNAFLARDEGTLMCRSAVCRSGHVTTGGTAWALEILPQGLMVAILVFLILMFLLLLTMCMGFFCGNKKSFFIRLPRSSGAHHGRVSSPQRGGNAAGDEVDHVE